MTKATQLKRQNAKKKLKIEETWAAIQRSLPQTIHGIPNAEVSTAIISRTQCR
jgi:hypothetical protein